MTHTELVSVRGHLLEAVLPTSDLTVLRVYQGFAKSMAWWAPEICGGEEAADMLVRFAVLGENMFWAWNSPRPG
jgi:hypothetical protein